MNTRIFLASALVLSTAAVACGNDPPAKSPDSTTAITETSSTKEDMPAPPAKDVEAAAAPAPAADTSAAAAPTAGGVIKLANLKITPAKKGGKDKPIELKDDGTVNVDGKPAAKIKGDEVNSTHGTSMLTVGVDGSLVGNGVKPGFKFEGDDLVTEGGAKLSVGDDGAITATKDGKTETLAKAENGASAKRAALVATVLWLTVPATYTAAPKAAAAGAAPGAKPAAATKPAAKK